MGRKLTENLVLVLKLPSHLRVGLRLEVVCQNLHRIDATWVWDPSLVALCPQDNPFIPTVVNETHLSRKETYTSHVVFLRPLHLHLALLLPQTNREVPAQ